MINTWCCMCIVAGNVHVEDRVDRVMTSRLTPVDARRHVCVCLYVYTYALSLIRTERETDFKIVHVENQVDSVDDIDTHHTCTDMCVYVCIFIYTHTPSHPHTHTLLISRHTPWMSTDMCVYVCIFIHTHTFSHAHTHAYTHTRRPWYRSRRRPSGSGRWHWDYLQRAASERLGSHRAQARRSQQR